MVPGAQKPLLKIVEKSACNRSWEFETLTPQAGLQAYFKIF